MLVKRPLHVWRYVVVTPLRKSRKWLNPTATLTRPASEVLGFLCGPSVCGEKKREEFAPQSLKILDDPEELLSANTAFVASFSEEDDLLSQWRGYCPNGSGFAICLSSDHVHALAKADGWMLLKCSYSEEEQRSAIEGIKRLVIDAPAASQVFATFLLSMGIAFKHRKFGEEKECRAIKTGIAIHRPGLYAINSARKIFSRAVCGLPPNPSWGEGEVNSP